MTTTTETIRSRISDFGLRILKLNPKSQIPNPKSEQGKEKPFTARLNDLVAGRFKLISISSAEVIFEDVNLGFKHRLSLYRPQSSSSTATRTDPTVINPNPNYPSIPVYNTEIPGIPSNIPRYNPNNTNTMPQQQKQQQKMDNDDDDDGDN